MKQMDNMLFQQNQSIDELKNRLNCIENGSFSGESELPGFSSPELDLEQIKSELTSDTEFISSIVDNIINNSNLSEIIAQIDTVHAETRELRDLLHAQQKTMNEMNIMLLKLISQSLNPPVVQANVILPTSTQRFESATTIGSASSTLTQIRCDDATDEVADSVADEVADSVADEVDDSAADEVDDSAADDGTTHIQLVVVDSSNMQTVD